MLQLKEIEKYAKINDIPIMEEEGISFLTNYIKENNIKTILEIGSAIGYSASKMALVSKDIFIDTIERDKERYEKAVENIKLLNLENQINIVNADALDYKFDGKYDLVFIDAAKSQYTKFFNMYKENLTKAGVIFTDNLDFHGYTNMKERIQSKNLRQLVTKIRKYITFLKENEEFETTFLKIGDGISISKRK